MGEDDLNIRITSWNVRGLGKLVKLKRVLNRLKCLKSKIVFLQETHFRSSGTQALVKRWPGQIFDASYSTSARGVAVLIHRSIPFQMVKVIGDTYGRYIIVQGTILTQKINLMNVYGPNEDNPSFFENLFLTVAALDGIHILEGISTVYLNQ